MFALALAICFATALGAYGLRQRAAQAQPGGGRLAVFVGCTLATALAVLATAARSPSLVAPLPLAVGWLTARLLTRPERPAQHTLVAPFATAAGIAASAVTAHLL